MKISFNGLKQHLNLQNHFIYLIFGEEPWQKEQSLELLKQHFKNQNFTDIERHNFDKTLDYEWFYRVSDNLSLFGDKTLIIIRFDHVPDEKSKKTLAEFSQNCRNMIDNQTALILLLPQLNAQQQKQKWFKTIDENGVLLPIWNLNRFQMKQLIEKLSQQTKLQLSDHACEKLIECTEGNLPAATQALEKLAITHSEKTVTEKDIIEIISTVSHYDAYALSEAFLNADLKKAILIINQLQHAGTESVLLLWILSQDIRLLLQFKHAKNSIELNTLFQKNRIWKNRQSMYQKALNHYTYESLKIKLSLCAKADHLIKSYQNELAWQRLVEILLP
ncbi:DNA polymerase III subunit delta [Thiotrichales bacterium 19S3-7]|nr:DNA polymerase III subunit delta [Thiotrichales bacterium 19S3-7]MCF6802033.1 DNA polymerase III subunit delta [Thiotrichales bacterium 19S3-11]